MGARKVGAAHAINSSNFIAHIIDDECTGCGKCVNVCPVDALSLVSRHSTNKNKRIARLLEENCIGCGVCVRVCKPDAIVMNPRETKVFTPIDLTHRVVLEAIEKGKLQNLIFDNQAHFNHRILASILGVILKLPPMKQIMASEQVKSKYITRLIERNREKNKLVHK